MSEISIIIPAKDETNNLPIVINEVLKHLRQNISFEILIVMPLNDNSISKLSKEQLKNIKVIIQSTNGLGEAIIEGVYNATKKNAVILMADGSPNPKDINYLLDYLNNFDFVFGSRYKNKSRSKDDTIITYYGNKFFTIIGNYFFNVKLTDILNTYVAFNTKKFKRLKLRTKSIDFCVELPIKVEKYKLNYTEIISLERKRLSGTKKMNEFRDGFKILMKMVFLFLSSKV